MSTRVQPVIFSHPLEYNSSRWHRKPLFALLLFFGLTKLLLQVAITAISTHAGYGIHRDELYYLVCGHHLAMGYVDQPPLVALQARLAELLFGYRHLAAFRLLPALAGALMVVLTGLIADALGGTRRAAALAMLSILSVPVFLATQSFLSMNAWEPVFWMTAVLAVLHLLAVPESTGWWLLLGASAGLGVENKVSAIFLIAALLLSLLVTPARHLLRRRGFWLAVGVTILLALPNLWWQATHGYPTWEWLHNVQHSDKDAVLPPLQFLLEQVLMLSPLHLAVWLPGVVWLLFGRDSRPWRFAGVLYLIFLVIMVALHAKDYYVAPIYPLCFAAGAVFWTEWAASSPARNRVVAAYAILMTLTASIIAPFAIPVLSSPHFIRYTHILHFTPTDSEQHPGSSFPEFFGDHLGWQDLAEAVSRAYHALPPEEQRQTGIVAGNYGQASAINILGRPLGLPVAISGHQNYWLWGSHGYTGKEMIVVTDAKPAEMLRFYHACTVVDRQTSPYTMPWEQRYIYVCHDRLQPFASSWSAMKFYW